jgi:hypothetical protein
MGQLTPDLVARLLAAVTAGKTMDRMPGGQGGGNTMNVLAALGMSKASAWGVAIVLAKYTQDKRAEKEARLTTIRWAWLAWLRTAPADQSVTIHQVQALAELAVTHHLNPAKRRAATIRGMARKLGVHHQTFRAKFKRQYQAAFQELQYQEESAIRAMLRKLG